jgi:hypothetical protein
MNDPEAVLVGEFECYVGDVEQRGDISYRGARGCFLFLFCSETAVGPECGLPGAFVHQPVPPRSALCANVRPCVTGHPV